MPAGDGSLARDTLRDMLPEALVLPSRSCSDTDGDPSSTTRPEGSRLMCCGRGGGTKCLQEAGRHSSFPLTKSLNLWLQFLICKTGIITVPMSQGGCED